MSDRELSNPMIYDISVDWDDAADGSDGGYDRKGNYIIPSAMIKMKTLRNMLLNVFHWKCLSDNRAFFNYKRSEWICQIMKKN